MVLKWGLRLFSVALIVACGLGILKREELIRLWAVNNLFDEKSIVFNFSNMDRAFLTVGVSRGIGPVSELPLGTQIELPTATNSWIKDRSVTSLLVLKSGEIVHESYHMDTEPEDLRIGWSLAKSYLSALMGLVVAEGSIRSLNDPVTKYAPQLAQSAYTEASVLNVLQMTSGINFNEDYLDYYSDINRMGRVLALGGTMDGFAADLKDSVGEPGSQWQYVSIDTHVLGMVIRGATGRDIASLLSEKIIQPLGLESDPFYLTDGEGVAFVLGGINQTTRDYARFGLMIEQNGRYQNQQILPVDWVKESTRRSAPTEAGRIGYGYQWWIPVGAPEGVFMARGIYGQYIYIDQFRDVVIVTTGADRDFREPGINEANVEMFRTIASAL